MQIWLETIGAFEDRVGKYLICPIHCRTKKDLPVYKIMEEPRRGDIIFHYVLQKASNQPSAITSISRVAKGFYIVEEQDSYCSYPPPYRKIDLYDHRALSKPITLNSLQPYREELEQLAEKTGTTRSPFNKNFKIKQLYLSRIPLGYLKIFSKISETDIINKIALSEPW